MKSVGQVSSNLSLGGVISSSYMLNVHFQQFDICNSERTNLNLDIYNSERTRLFILPTVFSSLKLFDPFIQQRRRGKIRMEKK